MSQIVYLDHAATTPLLPDVYEAMQEVLTLQLNGTLGNASALHRAGHYAHEIIEDARAKVARLINADPSEIIFVSGGSEANNTVTEIFAGRHITTSAIEHPSLLESARVRARELTILPVDRWGRIKSQTIPSSTDLLSVMLASNELGTLQDIKQLAEQKPASAALHSDATQAFGKIKLDVQELGVDYLTLSAHKIGGPIGVGSLYVRRGAAYRPLIIGGHQEARRRAGTSNVLAIAGFGAAAKWAWDHWSCRQYAKLAPLRDQLAERILAEIPYSSLNSPLKHCLPNILNVSFSAAEGESIQLYLDATGIMVSTGSACASGDIQPSHVLMATTGDAEIAHSSIRFSLGLDTTQADIDAVMAVLPNIVQRLRSISTVKPRIRKEASHD